MEFTVKKGDFLKELGLIQGVVEKKNTIPILSFVLLTAKDDQVVLVATDMDVSLRCTCTATVRASGTVAIQAKRLFEIVRNLPDADILIKRTDGDGIVIQCERYSSKVIGQGPENFPSLPTSEQDGIETDSETIYALISKTSFAITQEESRFALNGALLLRNEGKLTMVATDAHRLALIETKAAEKDRSSFRALIPKKTLAELSKLVVEHDGKVYFCQDENHLFFRVGPRFLVSRILSGQFPNYPLIIPKDNNKKMVANSSWLSQAVRRVALMADERSKAIKFNLSEGKLEIKANSSEAGEAAEIVPVEYDGSEMTIAFNAQYLIDFLNVSTEETVSIELKDEQSQVQVRPVDLAKYDYKYIIMPMRL